MTQFIEISGAACRAPGAPNLDAFWRLLRDGRCAVAEIGEDRWSSFRYLHPRAGEPGKAYTFAAGLIDNPWAFDASVFGVSPREAEQMDPQQRILLQVVWEAIEDAGLPPSALAGREVGVYVGASSLDYGAAAYHDPACAGPHFMTGNTLSIISNRISYLFDLRGPSFTVDTACSSSLVALNEAVAALRAGAVDTAIVAGVNVLASPMPFIGFSQATMLSPDGLCRAFDANGRGYVRAEGAFAVLLHREDVSPQGARSRGRIVGVAINTDGRTHGMSLPSSDGQAAVLRRAYEACGVDPGALAFIEAHGTGTRVGDPAEVAAIGEVLGARRATPLPIGSVKTNIGHLEPASGLAGLTKAMLALEHDLLPASLHFDEPNPDIDFDGCRAAVATENIVLPRGDGPRFAGVNSFGFGGTNAHVVLTDPAPRAAGEPAPRSSGSRAGAPRVLTLSAATAASLSRLCARYADRIDAVQDAVSDDTPDESSIELDAICAAAAHMRDAFRHRVSIVEAPDAPLTESLRRASLDETASAIVRAEAVGEALPVAFAYSGNGAQFVGMGLSAYESDPVFARALDAVDASFEAWSGWSIRDRLRSADLAGDLSRTSVAQPLLFAVQVALTEALCEKGLRPQVVFGHSVGEVAAAHAAGALTLQSAVEIVYKRSRHQEIAAGAGGMAVLSLPEEKAVEALRAHGCEGIEIAGVNSGRNLTLSGDVAELDRFGQIARKNRWVFKKLDLDYAFHSARVDAVKAPFLADLSDPARQPAAIPMISTVTGAEIAGEDLTAEYWWRNVREPVRFLDAVERAIETGCRALIEIGSRPVLTGYMKETLDAARVQGVALPSLQNLRDAPAAPVTAAVARAAASGALIDKIALYGPKPASHVALPLYPWAEEAYRFGESDESIADLFRRVRHPLLGWREQKGGPVWITHLDAHVLPMLADHRVGEQTVFPGAGYLEMALAAGREIHGDKPVEIRHLQIFSAIVLHDDALTEIRLRYSQETGRLDIASRRRLRSEEWTLNASARIGLALSAQAPRPEPVDAGETLLDAAGIYAAAASRDLNYGPAFRLARSVRQEGAKGLVVELERPDRTDERFGGAYHLHPAALDAAFHGLFVLFDTELGRALSNPYVPIQFGALRLYASGAAPTLARLTVKRHSATSILVDIDLLDEKGGLVARLDDARFRAVEFARSEDLADLVYRMETVRRPLPSVAARAWAPEAAVPAVEPGEPHVPSLLLDVAAKRMAYDLLAEAADPEGVLRLQDDPAREDGDRSDQRVRFLTAMALALEAGGLGVSTRDEAHPDEALADDAQTDAALFEDAPAQWRIAPETELPDFDKLIRTVSFDHPEDAATAALLCEARERARALAAGAADPGPYAPSLLDHALEAAGAASMRVETALAQALCVLDAWDEAAPMRLLALGDRTGSATRSLLRHPAAAQSEAVVLAEPEEAARLRGALTREARLSVAAGFDDLADEARFDLIVDFGAAPGLTDPSALAERAAGGATLVLAALPTLTLYDALFGAAPGWFDAGAPLPLSPLRSVEEWDAALTGAGFENVKAQSMGEGRGALVRARRAARATAAPEFAFPEKVFAFTDGGASAARQLSALGSVLGERLHPLAASPDMESDAYWRALLAEAATVSEGAVAVLDLAAAAGCAGVVDRAARLSALLRANAARAPLAIVTAARAGLGAEPEAAAIRSFARTARNEFPDMPIRVVEAADGLDGATLCEALFGDGEAERRVRAASETVPRLRRGLADAAPVAEGTAYVLGFDKPGSLDRLKWRAQARREPGPGEVEIEIAAAGLNFRDVMWALGLLPEEALEDGHSGPALGFECSGRVAATGAGVADLAVGDPVVAFPSDCFATHAVLPAASVAKIPAALDLDAAATLPVTFLTAWYALSHLARLSAGETVLIHGGAGGVGLAALQIAQHLGATVVATAGSPEKRAYLSAMGADHVLDSRSLDFVDRTREITGGDGVDVVLNSLAGEAMERSIGLLKPFGRFCELGKRDFYGDSKIGLRPFRRNLTYFGIDADQLLSGKAGLATRLLGEVMALFEEGVFAPLPYRRFPASAAVDAFRLMQRSGHIGKILIGAPRLGETLALRGGGEPVRFDAEGAHLVVGGLGGFGVETARWLVDHGARRLWLVSRSGRVSDAAAEAIAALEARGAQIATAACDATDRAALSGLLDQIRAAGPLKSVIHAPLVLDDRLIANLDRAAFETVCRAKIVSADLLDELTAGDPIEQFILFSSATTAIGNPGQANYVAANGYLEGLARRRRAQGKPALAPAWGAVGDVGVLTREAGTSEILKARLGAETITAREGLDALTLAMSRDTGAPAEAAPIIGRFNWGLAVRELAIMKSPVYAEIAATHAEAVAGVEGESLAEMIAGMDLVEAERVTLELVTGEIAKILRMAPGDVPTNRPLADLGMDSLMGLELRTNVQDRLQVDIPISAIADGATLADVAGMMVKSAAGGAGGDAAPVAPEADRVLAAQHLGGERSDEELRALRAAMSKAAE